MQQASSDLPRTPRSPISTRACSDGITYLNLPNGNYLTIIYTDFSTQMVLHSVGGGNERSGESVPPHPLRLRDDSQDRSLQPESIRLQAPGSGDCSSEHNSNQEPGSCEPDLYGVSSQASTVVDSVGASTDPCTGPTGSDCQGQITEGSSPDIGSGDKDSEGFATPKARPSRTPATPLPAQLTLLDIRRGTLMEKLVVIRAVRCGEVPVGYRAIRVPITSEPHGRFETVFVRPARWTDIRRYVISALSQGRSDPFGGLGSPEESECQAWVRYDPCTYSQDFHYERELGRILASGRRRSDKTSLYNCQTPDQYEAVYGRNSPEARRGRVWPDNYQRSINEEAAELFRTSVDSWINSYRRRVRARLHAPIGQLDPDVVPIRDSDSDSQGEDTDSDDGY